MTDIDMAFDRLQTIRGGLKDALNWRGAGPVRDATALSILPLALKGDVEYEAIRAGAQHLKDNHNKLYFLRTSTRYAITASLMAAGIDPAGFTAQLPEARALWKELKLRRGAPYEGICLYLLLATGSKSADRGTLATLKAAFDRLNEEHYWHVGTYTMVALTLALQFNGNAVTDGSALFAALKERRFKGIDLMSAGLVSTLSRKTTLENADWMKQFQDALRERKMRTASIMGSSVALAGMAGHPPEDYANLVEPYKDKLKSGPYRSSPAQVLALNFVNLMELKDDRQFRESEASGVTAVLAALQAYVAVQQQTAAIVAVTAAGAAGAAS